MAETVASLWVRDSFSKRDPKSPRPSSQGRQGSGKKLGVEDHSSAPFPFLLLSKKAYSGDAMRGSPIHQCLRLTFLSHEDKMRTVVVCILFSCATLTVHAQSGLTDVQGSPGVTVIKFGWSKERINWEGDPFGGPVENFEDVRRRRVDERRVERARATGNVGEAAKVEREMRAEQVLKSKPPAPPRYTFLYRASLKNTGARTVVEIDWDYVFFDAVTGEELGRREFTSTERIEPGKSKELSFTVNKPPTQRISVYVLGKKERDGLAEKLNIVRVQYSDGSVWPHL